MNCAKCFMSVDIDGPSAELNMRMFVNSETTDRVYEYIKLCCKCAKEVLNDCGVIMSTEYAVDLF